jgi:hypothetical protein
MPDMNRKSEDKYVKEMFDMLHEFQAPWVKRLARDCAGPGRFHNFRQHTGLDLTAQRPDKATLPHCIVSGQITNCYHMSEFVQVATVGDRRLNARRWPRTAHRAFWPYPYQPRPTCQSGAKSCSSETERANFGNLFFRRCDLVWIAIVALTERRRLRKSGRCLDTSRSRHLDLNAFQAPPHGRLRVGVASALGAFLGTSSVLLGGFGQFLPFGFG